MRKEKVSAWDFNELWGGLSGGDDFMMCYTENICVDVPGGLGPNMALVLGVAELLFWILAMTAGSKMLKKHRGMRKKHGNRRRRRNSDSDTN